MSEQAELNLTPPTSVVRNTVGRGKEQTSKNSGRPAYNADLQEYCDKYCHQLLPIIAEQVHQEKMQQEKLKEVKARLNFEGCSGKKIKIQEVSQHSESRTLDARDLRRKLRIRRDRSESPRHWPEGRRDGGVFNRLGGVTMRGHHHEIRKHSPKVEIAWVDTRSQGRRRKSQALKKMNSPNYGSDDPEDHLKIFQAAAKVERWAMPTWCHMFNYTLTGSARVWFDDLPSESIDSYDDLKKAFLANYLQQKKCIKDPVEIYHIKQREGESTEDFVQRFKAESRHVKGSPECMRISGFMHGITNPELIKRLHDNISKLVDEMMRITAAFLRGEVEASNQARKKALSVRKQHEVGRKQNFNKRGDFRNQQRSERRRDKITLLTKSPKEILALDKGKFKAPPPMTTPEEKINVHASKKAN
ncbi:reverse transcriptase domain-containing protein [Tanacetum coccineum]